MLIFRIKRVNILLSLVLRSLPENYFVKRDQCHAGKLYPSSL